MKCSLCQHENPLEQKFCGECGARLAAACASCGASNPPGQKFCGECGAGLTPGAAAKFSSPESYTPKHLAEKILTSKAALEGERKQVTVLFADLKGSMELLADRDPEEARKILDPVLERMMEAVHHFEGTVNQVMGDGIMALFGAPLAHEDHAVRACYAALRMQDSVGRYSEELRRNQGVDVQIRVGMNSGEVVVRSIGNDLHMDYTAVGQTTHLAARLEQLARPATGFITGDTFRLAEGYVQVKPIGPVPVKGLAEPVEVYELTGALLARTRFQAAAARGLTHFVGRDVELEQLRRALQLAGDGHGQVVAIVGEAGVGKSRLFYEFTHSHRAREWMILEGGSVSYDKTTSYLPVIDLLKTYFKVTDRDDQREIRDKVIGRVLGLDRSLELLLPAYLALLDLPVDDPQWQALDPAQRRQRTLDAVKRLLLRESQVQPLLLNFEDLHWIDSETQALLDSVVDSLPTARVLLLVNYRPEYEHSWGKKTFYSQLRLDPLPTESAGELLHTLLGDDPGLEPLKQILIIRTEGNPFFLEESVRTLVETKALDGECGAYRPAHPLEAVQVPATVHAVLAARIDRLPPEEKRLLQAASVIGKDVPFPLLQAIADLPEEVLRRCRTHLQAAEFLYETGLFPDLEYTFKHALTHEVAYASLLQERRRTLHARIMDAIETLYAERLIELVERLAHHAVRAGLGEKAVQYLREAGVKAMERSAYREAAEFLQQALALLQELPESRHMLSEALSIRLALAPALVAVAGWLEVEDIYRQALELCDRVGDASHRFAALWGLWYTSYGQGQSERAIELAQQALTVAQHSENPTFLLEAHHAMWASLVTSGRLAETAEHCERGVALYDRRERRSWGLYGTHDTGTCCRVMLGVTSWFLGRPGSAVTWVREALNLADEVRHPFTTTMAFYIAALVYYHLRQAEVATEMARAALELAQAQGFSLYAERSAITLARLLVDEGPVDEGLARLEEAVRRAGARGASSWLDVLNTALLAGAYGIAGQPEKGLREIEVLTARSSVGFYQPEIHRVRGELLVAQSPHAAPEAEACFRSALDLACTRQEKSLELRAAMSLARLWRSQGKRKKAYDLLAPIYGWFTEGFDTRDLLEATALLNELA